MTAQVTDQRAVCVATVVECSACGFIEAAGVLLSPTIATVAVRIATTSFTGPASQTVKETWTRRSAAVAEGLDVGHDVDRG